MDLHFWSWFALQLKSGWEKTKNWGGKGKYNSNNKSVYIGSNDLVILKSNYNNPARMNESQIINIVFPIHCNMDVREGMDCKLKTRPWNISNRILQLIMYHFSLHLNKIVYIIEG